MTPEDIQTKIGAMRYRDECFGTDCIQMLEYIAGKGWVDTESEEFCTDTLAGLEGFDLIEKIDGGHQATETGCLVCRNY